MKIKLPRKKKKEVKRILEKELTIDYLNQKKITFQNILAQQTPNDLRNMGINVLFKIKF